MSGFVYKFWFTSKKGSVKANYTKQQQQQQKTTTLYMVRTKESELADNSGKIYKLSNDVKFIQAINDVLSLFNVAWQIAQ